MQYERRFFEKVPKKFAHVSLESCDKHPKARIDFAKSWANNPKSIVLMGPVGLGKTYFAFAMIREALRCDCSLWPEYYTSPRLDGLLLDEESDVYEIQRLGEKCELLFIDDFGRERRSARITRQYFELINLRYANMLPTIISTNLTIDEIHAGLGDAIASRFQEFQIMLFEGEDFRKVDTCL